MTVGELMEKLKDFNTELEVTIIPLTQCPYHRVEYRADSIGMFGHIVTIYAQEKIEKENGTIKVESK